jgi:hypothetical protein
MALSDGNVWGGKIYARPTPDIDADRATVEAAGFTILGQDDTAGSSVLWVHGNAAYVGTYIADIEAKLALPGYFFRIPPGEEVSLVRIRQWNQYRQIAF